MNDIKEPRVFNEATFGPNELIHSYYHVFSVFGKIDKHLHNFYELNIVVQGSGQHFIGDKSFTISPGAIFIIPPFISHSYSFQDNDFKVFHILFKNKFFERYENVLNLIPSYKMFFDIEPWIRINSEIKNLILHLDSSKLDELFSLSDQMCEYEQMQDSSQLKKELLSLLIITNLCENLIYTTETSHTSIDNTLLYIMKSVEYIHRNYDNSININTLCKNANMSRSTFLRSFKRYYGISPQEYLTNYRISQSKPLLINTDKSITTIDQDCGFFDSSHFIRTFQKKNGISPMEFRKTSIKPPIQ